MDDSSWVVSLVVSWVPLLMFLGAVFWHARQIRTAMTTTDGRSLADVAEELARDVKRTNDLRRSPAQ